MKEVPIPGVLLITAIIAGICMFAGFSIFEALTLAALSQILFLSWAFAPAFLKIHDALLKLLEHSQIEAEKLRDHLEMVRLEHASRGTGEDSWDD